MFLTFSVSKPTFFCFTLLDISQIIDPDTGKFLGPNQDGEMCIRGPTVMKGKVTHPRGPCGNSGLWSRSLPVIRNAAQDLNVALNL